MLAISQKHVEKQKHRQSGHIQMHSFQHAGLNRAVSTSNITQPKSLCACGGSCPRCAASRVDQDELDLVTSDSTIHAYRGCTRNNTGITVTNADALIQGHVTEARTDVNTAIGVIEHIVAGTATAAESSAVNRMFLNPNARSLRFILRKYREVHTWLSGSPDIRCASTNVRRCRVDSEGGGVHGYTACNRRGAVYLCQLYFSNPSQGVKTLVHEGMHRVGVCPAGPNEIYHDDRSNFPERNPHRTSADSYTFLTGAVAIERQRQMEAAVGAEREITGPPSL